VTLPSRTLRLQTEIEIAASRERVWSVLADVDAWHEWNPVLKGLDGSLAVGAWHRLSLDVGVATVPIPVRLTEFRPPHEIAWRGGARRLVAAEHGFRVERIADQRSRVVHYESFEGLLVRLVGRRIERTLRPRYEATNDALRSRSER
jgi:hypothetical protein